MSIRRKLSLLAIGTQAVMALALIVYFLITAPAERLQSENRYFQKAASASDALAAETNKLATAGLSTQVDVYKKALADYQAATTEVGKLKGLASINSKMKDAVDAVARLAAGSESTFKKVTADAEALVGDFKSLAITTMASNPNVSVILVKAYGKEGDETARNLAQFHFSNFMIDVRKANDYLSLTSSIIVAKDAAVAKEIAALKQRSILLASALVVASFLVTALLALRASTDISKAIAALSSTVELMATGDLRARFGGERRDEIGSLGRNLDSMLDALNASMERTKAVAYQNRAIRESLIANAAESSGSAAEIDANAEAIKDQMQRVDRMIDEDIRGVDEMVGGINLLHERIETQDLRVSESAAAVTQMMASIENIDRIAARDREAAASLVAESDRSREVFALSFEKVAEISDSVEVISEMAQVIAGVASQTNILAMNAAIEAAHAGEYGKGFAVVADEIAKLAAASAESSSEIASTIASIVAKVDEADSTRRSTMDALDAISGRIREVSESIGEIYGNVSEMQAGSRQVLAAMENLKANSAGIAADSSGLEARTKSIGRSMDDLGRISHEVTASIGEIAAGLRMISGSVQGVSEHGERLGVLGQQLDEALEAFRTESAAPEAV